MEKDKQASKDVDTHTNNDNAELTEEQEEWLKTKIPNDPFSNYEADKDTGPKNTKDVTKSEDLKLRPEENTDSGDPEHEQGVNSDTRKTDKNKSNESKAVLVLKIAKENSIIFLDQYNSPFASIEYNGHIEVLPLTGKRYRNWLCKKFYEREVSVVSGESVTNALSILIAEAQFGLMKKNLEIRISKYENEIYYDLSNFQWQVVRITSSGWVIESGKKIIFRRFTNQSAQVTPSREYPPDILDRFIELFNLRTNRDKLLLKCYIVSMFIPNIPKPILLLHGEQGSAKTTLQVLIKKLVDPCSVDSHSFPRDISEFIQLLSHNHVAVFDNISNLKEWISDELCKAVTGSGFSKRALYSDDDDIVYNFKRCILLNGINIAATKPDLLDRSIIIGLERITKQNNRKLEEIYSEFEAIKPQVLGYIFDILVKYQSLKSSGKVKLSNYPRMADFAEDAEIISRSMGFNENEFIGIYYQNIEFQNEVAIESNPIAIAIKELLNIHTEWRGSPTDLLSILNEIAKDVLKMTIEKISFWPKSPASLSRRLKEVSTNLREIGIIIERPIDTIRNTRPVLIRKISPGEPESRENSPCQPSLDYFGNEDHMV